MSMLPPINRPDWSRTVLWFAQSETTAPDNLCPKCSFNALPYNRTCPRCGEPMAQAAEA